MRTHTATHLPLLLLLAIPSALSTAAPDQPTRIIAGYSGAFVNDATENWRTVLPLLAQSGFNAVDLKLHPANFDPADAKFATFVDTVANAVHEAGLDFYAYLYSADSGKRDPAKPAAPAFTAPDGAGTGRQYCLYQAETWFYQFGRVFYLAEASRRVPIRGVKMDIELIIDGTPCVCDVCFGSFAAARGNPGATVPPVQRWAWVQAHGGETAYMEHLERRLDDVAQAFADKAHAINPDLRLGFMPFGDDALRRPWARRLATERAPAVIDAWPMYHGRGYTAEVAQERDLVHRLNPHNLYVPWFRVNSYRPQDLGDHAFAAGANTDGYNLWALHMIRPDVANLKLGAGYALPPGFDDPLRYWAELGRGNALLRQWLAKPETPVPCPVIQPLTMAVDLSTVKVPALRPVAVADSASAPVAAPAPTGLRGASTHYLYVADPATPIRVSIRHLAGSARPNNLGYALVAANGAPVAEGQVTPGETATPALRVKDAGTYALLVTTTLGGGPWYSVKIEGVPHVLDATGKAYRFRDGPRQYFLVPAGTKRFRIECETGARGEQALVQVWGPDGAKAAETLLDSEGRTRQTLELTVTAPDKDQVWSCWIGKPATMPAGRYSENYWLRLLDVPSYFSDRTDTLLRPAY